MNPAVLLEAKPAKERADGLSTHQVNTGSFDHAGKYPHGLGLPDSGSIDA